MRLERAGFMSRGKQDFRRTVFWDVFAVQSGIYFTDEPRSADKCHTHHDKTLSRGHASEYLQPWKSQKAQTSHIYAHACRGQRSNVIFTADYCYYCYSLTRYIVIIVIA